VASVIYTGCQY